MRLSNTAVLAFCFLLTSHSSQGQATPSTSLTNPSPVSLSTAPAATATPFWTPRPVRDAQAIATIQSSIAALGGTEAISQVQTCVVEGQTQETIDTAVKSGRVVWEVSGSDYVSKFTGTGASTSIGSGHGAPFSLTADGKAQKINLGIIRSLFVPALLAETLLRELNDQNYSLQYGGAATVGTEAVTIIKTSSQGSFEDSLVTPQTWYFDSATNLPVRVEQRKPTGKDVRVFLLQDWTFAQYQAVSGVLYPFQITSSITNTRTPPVQSAQSFKSLTASTTIESIDINTTIPPSDFDSPNGVAR